ncbi:MAG: metallophosphoesterase [Candidatus Hodarchaeota archaeon]
MQTEKEEDLLEKAKLEEKAYNWLEAAKLYENVINSFMKKNLLEMVAETYKRLGHANARAADKADTAEKYVEINKKAIKGYKNAAKIFKEVANKTEELECEAEATLVSGFIKSSINEAKRVFEISRELFTQARALFSKKKKQDEVLRISIRELIAIYYQTTCCSEGKLIEQFIKEANEIIPLDTIISNFNIQSIAKILAFNVLINLNRNYIIDFKYDESTKRYVQQVLSLFRELKNLKLIEGCKDPKTLGLIYFAIGLCYCLFGYQYIEDERKQREYLDKGLDFLKKSVDLIRKTGDKPLIIYIIFWLDWFLFFTGRYKDLQKRIIKDIEEVLMFGKILSGLFSIGGIYANFLPTMYYTGMSTLRVFTARQTSSYANKAIKYAKNCLKISKNLPFSAMVYWPLTYSYSSLIYLAKEKKKQDEYAIKMLQSAEHAKNLAKNYEEGSVVSSSNTSLYKAYKTLADLAKSDEERIKMLSIALDAAEKYIQHPWESPSGIIEGQMRIGLLYEKIGVLSGKDDNLIKAKELFFKIIEESLERGYKSYAATAAEYIARIEDRLGNHTASSKYYEKAQNAYAELLKNLRYRLLKKRVNEKMDYAKAWSLIENAKVFHKRENHLKANESYKKALEILKQLQNFNYEAPYYHAWASQEEAEQLSKLEKHDKAIEQYEMTKNNFNNAIKSMEDISKKFKDKFALERIDKLKKVANLRIKYCSARLHVEKARILGKQGEHYAAAELFASAASEFRYVCNLFKLERERAELEAVYYLCRAWETMELAEKYEDPERFAEAANLFVKASKLFLDSKLKLLASGNSIFCQALELGCKFDEAQESEIKAQLYTKIRSMLRKAASSYEKGGFENGGNWALATSTYFDAAWSLIRADEELEFNQRKELLGVGSEYLKSAAELFSKAGYKDKEKEVLKRLNMVEKEEKIIFSALNSIKKPTISSSTVGIIAPSCSLETSQSPRLNEVRQFTEEERRIAEEKRAEIYECDTNLNILHVSDIQEGRFGIKEDIFEVNKVYLNFLSDLKDKLEILHRKNKIDIIVISGDLTSIGAKEEFDHLTNEFLPILNDVFLKGTNIVPKDRWILVPGNHDVEWEKGEARFNNFIQFCQENGFHQYKLNNPESIYSKIICRDKISENTLGIIALNSCLEIFDENSPNISNISNSYFSSFSKDWDNLFREMPKLMVCHHTLHSIKKDRFNHALNKLSDNNVLLALAGDIHKSESHADEISNIRCIPAGTILAKKTERQVGIDEVSRQFNLVNLNLQSGYVKWYTYIFEGTWREIKNESFYLEHTSFSLDKNASKKNKL